MRLDNDNQIVQNEKKFIRRFEIKGLEGIIFVSIIAVIFLISITITVTNLILIYRLRLFPHAEVISFPNKNDILFNGETIFGNVYLRKNKINRVVQMIGDLEFTSGQSKLTVDRNGIEINAVNGFNVYSEKTGRRLFPPDFSSLSIPSIPVISLSGGARNVHKIRSPIDQDLRIHSENYLKIRGNEGVEMTGKRIEMNANSIYFSSINSSIIFDGKNGIFMNFDHEHQPKATRRVSSKETDSNESNPDTEQKEDDRILQSKLCICGNNGRIFRLQLKNEKQTCADVRFPESINPCI